MSIFLGLVYFFFVYKSINHYIIYGMTDKTRITGENFNE